MNWGEQVFRYCERAQNGAFWAEPFNALSNGGFLLVAGWGALRLWRYRPNPALASPDPTRASDEQSSARIAVALLIGVTAAIGFGSFLFHTFATRWSRLADVLPIALFMTGYLALALRVFLAWSWRRTAVALGLFLAASAIMASVACPTTPTSFTTYVREPCLKGTMGYVPALVALLLTGTLLRRRHPAGRALLLAAGLFLVAMLLRWLDARACSSIVILGRPRGTHALWHLINAVTLFVLLHAAIETVDDGKRSKPQAG